jgi:hypothetical protein
MIMEVHYFHIYRRGNTEVDTLLKLTFKRSLITVTVGINFCTHILCHVIPTTKTRNFAVKG